MPLPRIRRLPATGSGSRFRAQRAALKPGNRQSVRVTSRHLLNTVGRGLLATAAVLVTLAIIHHITVESTVYFFDNLGNEVELHSGRDVTFLLYSLAGIALFNGALLMQLARSREHA